ncbi:MAG: 2,3-bisphosphoglycerate-independent phosphoglycerate mutase [Lentisphaerae bacterium ADurb.Bin242]|nr:MAG: 2,3-bisphosphoglycerate-independent phosphoglycerate mutase [Lentisphaerae bacterium ADurb.Bin242]
MTDKLLLNPAFTKRRGPVVLMILDGVGLGKYAQGDAVLDSPSPFLHKLMKELPFTPLKAHGTAVGLPSDEDMGNSEVGHNAMGCGRVFAQGAKLVSEAIASGKMFEGETWKKVVATAKAGGTLHFLGLFSDGNVHSNISHLKGMLEHARAEGVSKVRIHILLDGRDVPETSALDYIDPFETYLKTLGPDFKIASGGGRMVITMDRYGANWDMVRKGWEIHVRGKGRFFQNAHDAVATLRAETKAIDQDLPPFVISEDGSNPVGPVKDGDALVYFNFRGDRAIEISQTFDQGAEFTHFDRGVKPDVFYAGMMEYDGDLHIPSHYLVNPPEIDRTLAEYLSNSGVRQFAVSETQKYGHVTYFFNGNRSGKFSDTLDDYEEIPSDIVPFEQRPWMKCAQITDRVVEAIGSGKYGMIRLNFPNGDMVGHTGNMEAVIVAMESLDLCLARIKNAIEAAGGVLVISADHGNADDMLEHDKKGNVKFDKNGVPARKTSHSLNPVPCIVFDPESKGEYKHELREGLGISSLAATCIELLGYEAPEGYDPGVLVFN